MTYVLGIIVCACLFALFGITRPAKDCSGHCAGCRASCRLAGGNHND